MAFSLRKMLSNISYFTKPGDDLSDIDVPAEITMEQRRLSYLNSSDRSKTINFEREEPDSTSKCANSLKLPESLKNFGTKKGSLSDTDLAIEIDAPSKKDRRKCRKLKVDIKKASQSMIDAMNQSENSSSNVENTPKHVHLECKSSELFSEKIRGFDFNHSLDIFDAVSDTSSCNEEIDIESLSSDTDASESKEDKKAEIKMCRKVESDNNENKLAPSATPESFADVEVDKNEEERITLLHNYQMKLERIECFLKKLLTEFQFHIEVSKIFNYKSVVTALPGADVNNIPKILGEVKYLDNIKGISPMESWNFIMEKEDCNTKFKLKKQLLTMKQSIEQFVNSYLHTQKKSVKLCQNPTISFDLHKNKAQYTNKVNNKKKMKYFDFPDLREAMINLFGADTDAEATLFSNNMTKIEDESDAKCTCNCHSPTDSGLITKTDKDLSDQSITSSIGNFSLDSTTLSAYSESLDKIISYNSFQDASLYCTLLQKAAIERITFYVQVHSIQLKCDITEQEFESKNLITFFCPSCKITETEENGLLKHILSYEHGEKIHFLYKTAYIKKCVSAGKEIQPSTVLNPMKMYRDENKIVCFGDAMYACSLCFENLIIGESILMAHCTEKEHVNRKERLSEIVD